MNKQYRREDLYRKIPLYEHYGVNDSGNVDFGDHRGDAVGDPADYFCHCGEQFDDWTEALAHVGSQPAGEGRS